MKVGHQHRRAPTTTFPIVGKLRDWYRVGKMVGGVIYDSPSYPKEKKIFTNYLKVSIDCGEYILFETYEGSQFICMKDEHSKDKPDVSL